MTLFASGELEAETGRLCGTTRAGFLWVRVAGPEPRPDARAGRSPSWTVWAKPPHAASTLVTHRQPLPRSSHRRVGSHPGLARSNIAAGHPEVAV
jgi:hypothetical protein